MSSEWMNELFICRNLSYLNSELIYCWRIWNGMPPKKKRSTVSIINENFINCFSNGSNLSACQSNRNWNMIHCFVAISIELISRHQIAFYMLLLIWILTHQKYTPSWSFTESMKMNPIKINKQCIYVVLINANLR